MGDSYTKFPLNPKGGEFSDTLTVSWGTSYNF